MNGVNKRVQQNSISNTMKASRRPWEDAVTETDCGARPTGKEREEHMVLNSQGMEG